MNRRPATLGSILETLHRSRSCCVVGHVRPDGDCVGSQLALARALRRQGKRVLCWNQDPLPAKFAFLDPEGEFTAPAPGHRFDCVIAVDCASLDRLGSTAGCIAHRGLLLNIDHHASNTRYGDLNWVFPLHPSAGELVFQLFHRAGWPLTADLADCLYTAIATDTGSFQYASTRPATLRIAARLLQHGARLERISQEVYHSVSLGRVGLLRTLYQRLELHLDQQVACLCLRPSDYARCGARSEDSEGLIDHLRAIAPVLVACLLEETGDGRTRMSLRSKSPRIDVNQIAAQFGGGGHRAAAGATTAGNCATVRRRVLHALSQSLSRLAPVSPGTRGIRGGRPDRHPPEPT